MMYLTHNSLLLPICIPPENLSAALCPSVLYSRSPAVRTFTSSSSTKNVFLLHKKRVPLPQKTPKGDNS